MEPHDTSLSVPAAEHQGIGFLREELWFAFEIKLCQNNEMKGMLGVVRWDELGYVKWSWNVRRETWLSSPGSESKEFRREQPESRGRWCKRDLRRDGTNLQTLPALPLSHSRHSTEGNSGNNTLHQKHGSYSRENTLCRWTWYHQWVTKYNTKWEQKRRK